MKKQISGKSKKILSLLLAVVLMVVAIPTNVFAFEYAVGEKATARMGRQFMGYDGSKVYHYADDYALIYREDGSTYFREDSATTPRAHLYLFTESNKDEQWVYCIEAGVEFGIGSTYTSENGNNANFFMNLPADVRYGIRLALTNGWQPGKKLPISGINEDDFFYATQAIIWEYQQGLRKSPTKLVDNGPIKADQFYKGIKGKSFEKAYQWILQQMAKHATVPSFAKADKDAAPTYELKYNSNTKKYSLTLTDTNNLNIDLKKVSGGNVTVTRNGNQYTFTSSEIIEEPISFAYKKELSFPTTPLLLWGSPGEQTMVTGVDDPIQFYLNIKTEAFGNIKLVKTSEDGKVGNIPFHIAGNGIDQIVRTQSDGSFLIEDLRPGVYEVTEQAENKYEPQDTKRVTVVPGQTSTVTFNNVLKRGDLSVSKTAEDGFVEDKTFHLYGTSLSGLKVDEYAVTNEKGIATFKDVLISGSSPYVLEEVDVDEKYVVPADQTATIEWNKVTQKSFENILKKWRATITKSDAETGKPQGDASLAGAKYGVFKGDQLIDTYITDSNGQFVTDYYVCDSDWSIKELAPSTGYLINEKSYHVGAEPGQYDLEYNDTAVDVTEQVTKGRISLIKHTDDGSTGIETPEEGAEFQIFLRSAGSYEKAKDSERDVLTCDEHGYAESKDLPYGWYTVHQTKGWDGRELIDDFDVFISKDGETYRYLLNNANFESRVKIVKKDKESGNVVPQAGHGYEIYNPQGEKITMTVTYPEVVKIDTFYTDSNGYLITPEPLPWGKGYSIVEVETVEPYVLDPTPVKFDIIPEVAEKQDGITIVTVEKANMPQKGTITLYKDGEEFSSVAVTGGEDGPEFYQPVYSKTGQEGGVYDIIAMEDVISGGVLRYHKDDVVAVLTTGKDGTAVSDPLYLSTYKVVERTAPQNMVLNPEPVIVTLSYAGQNIEITNADVNITNERQKAEIDLLKALEQDERFGIGNNAEIQNVAWGLYAAEPLKAADGMSIPKDGLLEIVYCDKDGKAVFQTDIPMDSKLYVREYTTDSHYVISNTKYPVEFTYQGQETAVVHISVNDGETIENDLIRGSVSGKKVDEAGNGVAKAVFGLFAADETEFEKEHALMLAESDSSGKFAFHDVPYGDWIIKELSAPSEFVLSGELFKVTISEQEQCIEITAVNQWITGTVKVAKVDKNYPENKLSGALFGVYMDVNGNKVYDEGIDSLVDHLTEIEQGIYQLGGLKYHGYFLHEEKSPDGFVQDDRYYYFEVNNAGETVVIENVEGVGFVNQPEEVTEIPQTGDQANLWLWAGIASGALAGIAVLTILYIRKRKTK